MPFKISDRVRYTGHATFRSSTDKSAIVRHGALAMVTHGPIVMPQPGGQLICYTVRFDDGDEWLARDGDLEAAA